MTDQELPAALVHFARLRRQAPADDGLTVSDLDAEREAAAWMIREWLADHRASRPTPSYPFVAPGQSAR